MNRYIILILFFLSMALSQTSLEFGNSIKSLALPGWGERAIGEYKRANSFFITEAGIWLIYISSKKLSNLYEENYKSFASLHANVSMLGKDYLFAVNIGHYDSLDDYNQTKERQRLVNEKYNETNNYNWVWDTKKNRIEYDELRMKSVIYRKYAKFAIGGLVLNRLVSFFDTIYLEKSKMDISVNPSIYNNQNNISINFSYKF